MSLCSDNSYISLLCFIWQLYVNIYCVTGRMIRHQIRLCKKIRINELLTRPLVSLHHTQSAYSITPAQLTDHRNKSRFQHSFLRSKSLSNHRYKSTPPEHRQSLRQFVESQSSCAHYERREIVSSLTPHSHSIKTDVLRADGTCSACNTNFFHMDTISPATFRQFIEFQLDRPEHMARGFGFLRTIPLDQIRVLLRKHLLVIEKLTRTIPQHQEIVAVVDQVNINIKGVREDLEWCHRNRHRIVEVTEFFAPHLFRIRAYDAASKKTYAVKCKYFFKGLDDLYCLYLSLLLPTFPRVVSYDTFSNYIARAREFEAATGAKDFTVSFQKMLSNVVSPGVPRDSHDGFYFPSSCYASHHVVEKGQSYCIQCVTSPC